MFIKKNCYIFKWNFGYNDDKKSRKVKGYCYYRGKYKSAGHSICNVRYTRRPGGPETFSLLKNYGLNKNFAVADQGW